MYIMGIDPGLKGGIVILDEIGTVYKKYIMPTIGKEFDIHSLYNIIATFHPDNIHVFIENVHAIFGASAGSTFKFGYGCGILEGIVCSLKLKYTKVQPKIWQKEIFEGIPEQRKPSIKRKDGKIVKGKLETKKMSLMAYKRLFPIVDLRPTERSQKSHDGLVDALLIAEYGRRKLK